MTDKLIYGREQLNEEFISYKKRLEETRNVLNNTLKNKLEIVEARENAEIINKKNKTAYKKYKKKEFKRLIQNIAQVTAVFGIPMFLCNFSIFTFDVHTLNIVLGSLIGFGDLSLIGVHILDVNSFKKECPIIDKKSMSLLEDSLEEAYLDNEITKLIKDIKEIDDNVVITTVEGYLEDDHLYNAKTKEEIEYYGDSILNYQEQLNTMKYTFKNNKLVGSTINKSSSFSTNTTA